jgi:hypothetical protein
MRAALIQTAFNGGELSPYIFGRTDVAKYPSGCERMVNFLPLVQGPAITRPGTPFVAEVKNSADQTWLVRFEFSEADCYMMEFGDQYVRFYYNHGQVLSGGVPYEIASPYTADDLTNSDSTFALRYVQTGDVVYLVHPAHPPYKLTRLASTNWTLAAVDFVPPPFKDLNTSATTIYASAATGSVTLTASINTFTASHIGQYLYLGEKSVRDVPQWETAKAVTAGAIRRSDGKNYQALNNATTGSVKPTHIEGAAYDGDGGVQWLFLDAGYGWAKITAVASGISATATVVSRLPDGAVLGANATSRWAFQAWNATDGYPSCVTFFRERLVFARNAQLWFSVSSDFENFATEVDGQVTDDAGFDRTLASDGVNAVRWLSPGDVLLVGTLGDEWAITEATTTDPFGPNNVKAKRQSKYGSNRVMPVRAGNDTLFVQKAGRKVRAMAFRFDEDGFESPDVTKFAHHLQKPGIVDMAFQQEPWSIVWCARRDGLLIGLTFDREHDVVAWHRHPFSDGFVETVETIPAPDSTRDDLWLIVRYTINGATKRYVCYLGAEDDESGSVAQEDWCYSDMLSTYSGAPATTISGLGYLEGKEVWVLADGARHPNRTVSGGQITLDAAASKVQVGLPCEGFVETMNLDGGSANGTAQGKIKRINVAVIRVNRSLGWLAGADDDHLEEGQFRSPADPMGSAPPAFTGDVEIEWSADYDTRATMVVKKDRPMPVTLVAVMPQLTVSEGR